MEPTDGVAEGQVAEYLLVYYPRGEETAWWARGVDRHFAHVEIWSSIGEGFYTAIRPYHHFLIVDIMDGEPTGTVQKVTAMRRAKLPMFPAGLKTCVSVAKAVIGVRHPLIITPRQLFDYVEKRQGVV